MSGCFSNSDPYDRYLERLVDKHNSDKDGYDEYYEEEEDDLQK